jgi:hypothetical protein
MLDTDCNPAVFEISGKQLMKTRADYDACDEAWCERLLGYASLPEEEFLQVLEEAKGAFLKA